ncbi:MAG: hypothetical protein KAH22_03350, partial [Thiotrichaceae bacterium]|nr:hypothetical protein [Thiotrichaceae bacterium]
MHATFLESIMDVKNPYVLFILIIIGIWSFLNYYALIKGNPSDASFKRSVSWLKEEVPAKLYLNLLSILLNPIARWMGDHAHFEQAQAGNHTPQWMKTWFGFNPFTASSYEKILTLAFLYPMVSFFITWAWTNNGKIGSFTYIPSHITNLSDRWLLLLSITVLMTSLLFSLKYWQGWKQWVALLMIMTISSGFIVVIGGNITTYLIGFFLYFFILFLPIYLSGFLLSWLILRNRHQAHQLIYPFAFAFA